MAEQQFTNEEIIALRRFLEKDDKAKQEALQAFREGKSKLVIDKIELIEGEEAPKGNA